MSLSWPRIGLNRWLDARTARPKPPFAKWPKRVPGGFCHRRNLQVRRFPVVLLHGHPRAAGERDSAALPIVIVASPTDNGASLSFSSRSPGKGRFSVLVCNGE